MEWVLARTGRSEFGHQGKRVVVGQRIMQAAIDMFLGWTRYGGHDYLRAARLRRVGPAGLRPAAAA
jgi:Uncharacterized protein conserved in bacteria (DUF2252)